MCHCVHLYPLHGQPRCSSRWRCIYVVALVFFFFFFLVARSSRGHETCLALVSTCMRSVVQSSVHCIHKFSFSMFLESDVSLGKVLNKPNSKANGGFLRKPAPSSWF